MIDQPAGRCKSSAAAREIDEKLSSVPMVVHLPRNAVSNSNACVRPNLGAVDLLSELPADGFLCCRVGEADHEPVQDFARRLARKRRRGIAGSSTPVPAAQ